MIAAAVHVLMVRCSDIPDRAKYLAPRENPLCVISVQSEPLEISLALGGTSL